MNNTYKEKKLIKINEVILKIEKNTKTIDKAMNKQTYDHT